MTSDNLTNDTNKETKIGKIVIDRDMCIGAGPCVALAPQTFQLDDEGKAIVINPDGNTAKEIMDAAMSCPVMAIKIYDTEGNQIYP